MACFIMTGEIMGGEIWRDYSKTANFTCDFCFAKFFLNFKIIYSFLFVPDAFASAMINDDI